MHDLAEAHRGWVEGAIEKEHHPRDGKWTASIAVGSESFVKAAKVKLGIKAKGRRIFGQGGSWSLRESPAPYKGNFGPGNDALRPQNEYLWDNIA